MVGRSDVWRFAARLWVQLEAMPVVGMGARRLRYPLKRALFVFQAGSRRAWEERIALVKRCPDNAAIPRVPTAGLAQGGAIVMHNGIRVLEGSYYGAPMAKLLRENRGVHEPQEERVFAEVLRAVRPGGTMIELGAYWGFYSLWFARAVSNARCILVEPSRSNLEYGRENFRLNGYEAEYVHGFVGADATAVHDGVAEVTVDDLCARRGISRVDVLHSDIQGAEVHMLVGARELLSRQGADFVFVSTHSEDLHQSVRERLRAWAYRILVDVSPRQSFSEDGLIVAAAPQTAFGLSFEVSKRR